MLITLFVVTLVSFALLAGLFVYQTILVRFQLLDLRQQQSQTTRLIIKLRYQIHHANRLRDNPFATSRRMIK